MTLQYQTIWKLMSDFFSQMIITVASLTLQYKREKWSRKLFTLNIKLAMILWLFKAIKNVY